MQSAQTAPSVVIACGGTGGHLFPGLAVAEELARLGCAVSLVVSPKEVDQQAVRSTVGMEIVTLPAVGLVNGQMGAFVRGFWRSYIGAKQIFKARPPQAVLAMGGFTSAPPILAGRRAGAVAFLHESNSIPGRANCWLAPFVDSAFTGFPGAARQLRCRAVQTTGTPVRSQFQPMDARACRVAFGLDADRPVLLMVGGSQGARGVNQMVANALPLLSSHSPALQFLHLTGAGDYEKIRDTYTAQKLKAVVRPFLAEMEMALGAATAVISRAGASSLAELAAMRVPALLVPFPAAANNHQFYNAWAFVESGAARMIEQEKATTEMLVEMIGGLLEKSEPREAMKEALKKWHRPDAAKKIAGEVLAAMGRKGVHIAPVAPVAGQPVIGPVHPHRVPMPTAN